MRAVIPHHEVGEAVATQVPGGQCAGLLQSAHAAGGRRAEAARSIAQKHVERFAEPVRSREIGMPITIKIRHPDNVGVSIRGDGSPRCRRKFSPTVAQE